MLKRNRLAQLVVALVVMANAAAFFMLLVEHHNNPVQFNSFGDALWWSIVTLATVGYGDKVPVTVLGRVVGSVTILSGLILVSLLTATISSVFVARKIKESQGLQDIDFTNHIVICGWNPRVEEILSIFSRFGAAGARMRIVLANEAQPESMEVLIEGYPKLDLRFVRGDYAREPVLLRANIKEADAAIIVPDIVNPAGVMSDDKTVLSLLTIKSVNPTLRVFANIVDRDNLPHIRRANADDVIVSDQFVPFFLANQVLAPGTPQVAKQLLTPELGTDIHRTPVPNEYVGKTYGELLLHFKKAKDWTLIGLVTEEETVSLGDILSHDTSAIDAFIERKFKEAGINVAERAGMRVEVNPPFDHEVLKKDIAIVIGAMNDGV